MVTVGQALAALPGPADLKEFVFLLFFQKQKKKKKEKSSSSTCFHLLPESRPRRTPLCHCNKANLSLQTISSPPSQQPSQVGALGTSREREKRMGARLWLWGLQCDPGEATCGCRSCPSAPSLLGVVTRPGPHVPAALEPRPGLQGPEDGGPVSSKKGGLWTGLLSLWEAGGMWLWEILPPRDLAHLPFPPGPRPRTPLTLLSAV